MAETIRSLHALDPLTGQDWNRAGLRDGPDTPRSIAEELAESVSNDYNPEAPTIASMNARPKGFSPPGPVT